MTYFGDKQWNDILLMVKDWHSVAYIWAIVAVFVGNWIFQAIKGPPKKCFPPYMAVMVSRDIEKDVTEKTNASRRLKSEGAFSEELPTFKIQELKIGELLGDGSFCDVKEVKSITVPPVADSRFGLMEQSKKKLPNGNHPYAIKHVKTTFLDDKDEFIKAASELILECKYLSGLNHRNIIRVRGVAKGDASAYENGGFADSYFVLMDRIETTLKNKLAIWKMADQHGHGNTPFQKGGQNTPSGLKVTSQRLEIVRDLASACEYLHAQRLVYRDIKPSNIGFDWKGTVKLLDFGLVAELPEEGSLTKRSGTVRYMSPECALGKYDCQTDVFSLTLILWEILTLKNYFNEYETNLDHVKAIIEGKRETINENWPIGIRKLMAKGWGGNANKRPTMKQMGLLLEKEIEKMQDQQDLNESATNDSAEVVEKQSGGSLLDVLG
mmetsp:Transcript_26507/g.39213  ORF Transcript_26507/g.39213 Transcript_26507/m.39213 type:complete len:438 (+) Transcript_26507:151-1464(+)